jgi:glycosyltransferase involved in cell wall biosynthesis
MRVLLLHNRYRLEGGEERCLDELEALLSARGHDVARLERSSREAGAGRAARGMLSGGEDPSEVAEAVRSHRAEVVHAHNVHPLFGWKALAAARHEGARTVLHLHNFRLFCAVSVAYRDGAPCFRCRATNTWPGFRLRCRGNLSEAGVYAAGLLLQEPQLMDKCDALIAVSADTAERLQGRGVPPEREVAVLPNFVRRGSVAERSRAAEGEFALASGRLVEEKGFATAITAATAAGVPLRIAGDGPDEARLQEVAASAPAGAIRFTGRLPAEQLAELRRRAAVVLVPSRWHEPCPYSALDAMADGVPVLASDRGGLPELVGAESTLPAEDAGAWTAALTMLWSDPSERSKRGDAAIQRVRQNHSEDAYYDRLMAVYRAA